MSPGLFDRLQGEPDAREGADGLRMADVLALPDPLRELVNWLMRQEAVSLAGVAAHLEQDEATARATLAGLTERGYVREMEVQGELRYSVRLAPRRKGRASLDLWRTLDEKTDG